VGGELFRLNVLPVHANGSKNHQRGERTTHQRAKNFFDRGSVLGSTGKPARPLARSDIKRIKGKKKRGAVLLKRKKRLGEGKHMENQASQTWRK